MLSDDNLLYFFFQSLFKYFEEYARVKKSFASVQKNTMAWQGKEHLLNIPRPHPSPTGACPINILSDSDTKFHLDSTTYYTYKYIIYISVYEHIIYVQRVHNIPSVCHKLFKKLLEKLSLITYIIIYYYLMTSDL